jgi:hypothetical protein
VIATTAKDACLAQSPLPYNWDMQFHTAYTEGYKTALQQYGLEKQALNLQKAIPYAIGAGIPLLTAGGLLLSKPGIQANILHAHGHGTDTQQADLTAGIPTPATNAASRIQQILSERNIDPMSLRVAVDAPPGSGKTVLSKALANQMNLKHYGLDWLPNNKMRNLLSGGAHIEQMPRAPHAGEILEHSNILRGYDPELFDAIIHIQKDPETIKQQITKRGRGAGIGEFMDYDKNLAVGRLAFGTLAGNPIDLGEGTYMKLRPREGWGTEKIDEQLSSMGIDPSKLSRHEKLLSLHAGKKETGAGWVPYFKSPFSGLEKGMLAASVPLGIGAALAAKHFLH